MKSDVLRARQAALSAAVLAVIPKVRELLRLVMLEVADNIRDEAGRLISWSASRHRARPL